MITDNKKAIITTIKKAQSHLGKILEMIENDEYCIDVIQQLSAVDGYIKSIKRKKLEDHLRGCFVEQMAGDDSSRAVHINEILRALKIIE